MARLIIILLVVLVASWGLLAVGANRGGGSLADITQRVEELFGGVLRADLEIRELAAGQGCRIAGTRITIGAGGNCDVSAAQGGFRVRTARLSLIQGDGAAQFRPARSDEPRPVQPPDEMHRFARDGTLDISAFTEGGVLELRCAGGTACIFALGRAT